MMLCYTILLLEMRLDIWSQLKEGVHKWPWGHFPLGGIFLAEGHFPLFKDQLAASGRQKTKENITPRGKFRQVENSSKVEYTYTFLPPCRISYPTIILFDAN